MLVINHKGNTPQQRFYSVGVKENNKANKVVFVLEAKQSDVDLSGYVCNLKVKSKEGDYLDLILLDGVYSEKHKTLSFTWVMERKTTKYRNLELQLEFIDTNEDIVWQTQICELELSNTIKVGDEQPNDKELSALKQMEQKVVGLDNEVEELKEEVKDAKEIVIDNPDEYLNENGLEKIIRVEDENGTVEKSYFIDKIHHESTLVKCEQHREENGYEYDDWADLKDDLGSDQFYEIFGSNVRCQEYSNVFSLYYNQNGEITKGVKIGRDDFENYGCLNLIDCTPNKVIRVIVGKYFEYDGQGNKVFDEHCALYSENFANIGEGTKEITEERQVFELITYEEGRLYFDSDGNELGFGNTRFILYGFEVGEPAYDEYKKREIGGGDESVIITLTKGNKVRQVNNKTFLDMCENGLFTSNDLGTMASIPKLINGQTMRIRLIGLNHDVLSNTDLGELEPNGVKAKTTWQFYDMPFQKVNLGLPYEEEKTGYVRSSQPSDVPIEECAEVQITPDAPSNMHGYTSAVGLLNAMQEICNSLPNWLKDAIKTVRKDCFISEMSANGWNYENFDSTGTVIAYENDRYGSCINTKLFCLSATEIGIIPNPEETFNAFPYKIPDNDGNDVMLEGTKYEYFNETYPYTSEPEEDRRRPCKYNDQDWYYWLRSPYLLGCGRWGVCNYIGGVDYYGTIYDYGVAPAFCI